MQRGSTGLSVSDNRRCWARLKPVRPLDAKHSHSAIEHVSSVGYRVVPGVYSETLLDPVDGRPVLKRNLD